MNEKTWDYLSTQQREDWMKTGDQEDAYSTSMKMISSNNQNSETTLSIPVPDVYKTSQNPQSLESENVKYAQTGDPQLEKSWRSRERRVLFAIVNCHLAMNQTQLALNLLEKAVAAENFNSNSISSLDSETFDKKGAESKTINDKNEKTDNLLLSMIGCIYLENGFTSFAEVRFIILIPNSFFLAKQNLFSRKNFRLLKIWSKNQVEIQQKTFVVQWFLCFFFIISLKIFC